MIIESTVTFDKEEVEAAMKELYTEKFPTLPAGYHLDAHDSYEGWKVTLVKDEEPKEPETPGEK